MSQYVEYDSYSEWLKARRNTLGASEVASVIGIGFMSTIDLWREKTCRKQPNDLSENKRVKYGIAVEEHLRALFSAQFVNKYQVEYHAFRVYKHDTYKFMTCTLDGELIRLSDGAKGVWECKTAWVMSKRDLDEWNGRIKQAYFCQICAQLLVTNYDFAIVTVQLIMPDGNSEIRHYNIERGEVKEDIEYIKNEAIKFWRYVIQDKQPPQKLML